jgi:hypothetical protein
MASQVLVRATLDEATSAVQELVVGRNTTVGLEGGRRRGGRRKQDVSADDVDSTLADLGWTRRALAAELARRMAV